MKFFKIYLNGLTTGMMLQLAIGPVFFVIFNITINNSILHGLSAASAAVAVDYIFILLAVTGISRFMNSKGLKRIISVFGALILLVFGALILLNLSGVNSAADDSAMNSISYGKAFTQVFLLTASNPLTIVFWTGLFAVKTAEKNYNSSELLVFGFAAGSATAIFMGISIMVLSSVKQMIPVFVITGLNAAVGILLVIYGFLKILTALRKEPLTE